MKANKRELRSNGNKSLEILKKESGTFQDNAARLFNSLSVTLLNYGVFQKKNNPTILGVYYSVAVRRIWPYFGCGIRLLQENQYGIRFLYCYAVAETWNLNEWFTAFSLLRRTFY